MVQLLKIKARVSSIWAKRCILMTVCVFYDLTWLPLLGVGRKSWYFFFIWVTQRTMLISMRCIIRTIFYFLKVSKVWFDNVKWTILSNVCNTRWLHTAVWGGHNYASVADVIVRNMFIIIIIIIINNIKMFCCISMTHRWVYFLVWNACKRLKIRYLQPLNLSDHMPDTSLTLSDHMPDTSLTLSDHMPDTSLNGKSQTASDLPQPTAVNRPIN